jgi:hypothetical protein
MIIAQGKAADLPRRSAAKAGAATLGKSHPVPTLPSFWFGAPAGWRAKPEKGEQIIFRSEPRAAFVPRWPWATIISSLQDFSLARSARKGDNPINPLTFGMSLHFQFDRQRNHPVRN